MNLHTKRLRLREFTADDITEKYMSWLNDTHVTKYSTQRFLAHTLETSLDYLESFKGTDNDFIAIETLDDNELIGTLTIYRSIRDHSADLGLLIGKEYWGYGYGTEAWNAILDLLSGSKDVLKITAGTLRDNVRMRNVLEKSGMVFDGTRYEPETSGFEPKAFLYYSLYLQKD